MLIKEWTWGRAWFVAMAAITNFILAAVVLRYVGTSEEGVKLALRATARVAFLWFVVAFTASSLHTLWPGKVTAWLLERRQFIGAAFPAAFLTHVALIFAVYRAAPIVDADHPVPLFEIIGGIPGILLVYAMLATSFGWVARVIGRTWWERLHRYGSYYVMGVFIYCFCESFSRPYEELVSEAVAGIPPAIYYWPFLVLSVGAAALRVAAFVARRRQLSLGLG